MSDLGPSAADQTARRNVTLILLVLGLAVLIALVAYFAVGRSPDQDKLKNPQIAAPQARTVAIGEQCESQATYNLIKRELFSRAAQLRGADQADFAKLADYAVIRVENPVVESQDEDAGTVDCSGALSIDLPPGLAMSGGRRTLTSNVDYTLQPSGPPSLRNANAVVSALSTITRIAEPQATTLTGEGNETTPEDIEGNVATAESAAKQVGPRTDYPGRPSFDCDDARTRGEISVCEDSGLAALDVNMTTQYRRAFAEASPDQRDLLRVTAQRFYAYRDRCPDNHCIGEAYVGRMREIRDIMEGRWQPQQR